jgi:acetaldehyde dehydrogenase
VARFSGVHHVKAILNVSPAVPPATFRTTVHAIVPGAAAEAVRSVIAAAALRVRTFAPGYDVIACTVNGDHVVVTVEITPDSDVLPRYAGNLDIIDSAAILVAELHAARINLSAGTQAYR